jgi:hypothetical protein
MLRAGLLPLLRRHFDVLLDVGPLFRPFLHLLSKLAEPAEEELDQTHLLFTFLLRIANRYHLLCLPGTIMI